jgi:hypothetical protein
LPEGVAAVDDDVARLQQIGQPTNGGFGRASGGQHDPDGAWRFQLGDQCFQSDSALRAIGGKTGDGFTVLIVYHGSMAAAQKAARHVAAHTAQADDSDLHLTFLLHGFARSQELRAKRQSLFRHSREGGNPRAVIPICSCSVAQPQWIPAFAEMTVENTGITKNEIDNRIDDMS